MTRAQLAAIADQHGVDTDLVAAIEREVRAGAGHDYSRHDADPDAGQPGDRLPLRVHRVRGAA